MKPTLWNELDAKRCTIIEGDLTNIFKAVKLSHPNLKRPRWFQMSRRGNWYSRYTGRDWTEQPYAQGYIVVGEIIPGGEVIVAAVNSEHGADGNRGGADANNL